MFYHKSTTTGVITKCSEKESNYVLSKAQGWKQDNKKFVKFEDRQSLFEKVINELAKPLTKVIPKGNIGNGLLPKKEWRVMRSIHGMFGIPRYKSKQMANQL